MDNVVNAESMLGSPATMFWGLVFSSIGVAYCMYGKRQSRPMYFVAGVGLSLFSFFVDDVWMIILIGSGLIALPCWIDL